MSDLIKSFLNNSKDEALTSEHKEKILNAIVPIPTGEISSLLGNDGITVECSIPKVAFDKDAIQKVFACLLKDNVDVETIDTLTFLIQSEIYGDIKLEDDEQVLMLLSFLELQGYDSIIIEDCKQIIQTPVDEDIPNPLAYVELLSESLNINRCPTLVQAIFNYLEESMVDS